jgi:excisionase family DNA binding protein
MKRLILSKGPDTAFASDGWLTRAQAAKLLGISKTRVQQLDERGDLRSVKDERGRCRYDPIDVLELVEHRRDEGIPPSSELDRLFEMFRERRTILEIRLATGYSTETIRRLYAEYRTPVDRDYERVAEAREAKALLEHERCLRDISRQSHRRRRDEGD